MRIKGISWVGVKTGSYDQMTRFFTEVIGLSADFERADFAVFRLPDGDKLEIFGPHAMDSPEQFARDAVVAGFLVEDIEQASEELRNAGIELVGECQSDGNGYFWQHFRSPDGKIFELVYDPEHR